MAKIIFLSHPEVRVDPSVPVPRWSLSDQGEQRMRRFCIEGRAMRNVSSVFTSTEQKAVDCGRIANELLSIGHFTNDQLGEIDRSSTGYLPHLEHAEVSKKAFEYPERSIRGWEKAIDAQTRIKEALRIVWRDNKRPHGDVLIVSHGGVGLLLLCSCLNQEISRKYAMQNAGGGCYFVIDSDTELVLASWEDMDAG